MQGNEFEPEQCGKSNMNLFCVICLQNCDPLNNTDTNLTPTITRNLKEVFRTFSKYLRMSEELKALNSFAAADDLGFTQLFHCCESCENSLRKLDELHQQLKLISNETALISATLTAKIIESSKSIRISARSRRIVEMDGHIPGPDPDPDLEPATSSIFPDIGGNNRNNHSSNSTNTNTFALDTSVNSGNHLLLGDIVAEQLHPESDNMDVLNWPLNNWGTNVAKSSIQEKQQQSSSSCKKVGDMSTIIDGFDQQQKRPDLNKIKVNYQLYQESVPKEVRQFRNKVLNYYSVKVSLTNVNDLSPTGLELRSGSGAECHKGRPKRRRKSANPRCLSSLSKSKPFAQEILCLTDDEFDEDNPFSPIRDEDEDFYFPLLLPNITKRRSVSRTLKKTTSKSKSVKRKSNARLKDDIEISDANGQNNDNSKLTAVEAQEEEVTNSTSKTSDRKIRKSKSKMYRETSPNKYLYGEKFTFERVDNSFKCGSCDFSYDFTNRITPMVNHVKERHYMKKTNRPYYKSRKLVTVGPNKFLYVGKFIIEKVDDIYKCGTCNYSSENRQLTCRHVRLQHFMTEKTKACHICGKHFQTTDKLNLHLSRHKDERPYTCEICGKSFKTAPCLGSHKKTHAEDVDKNKQCEICGKKFAYTQVLKNHLVTHTGEKNFECDICHSRFRDAGTLTNHKRIHEGLKLYSCHICGMKFSQSGSVNRHVRSVHQKIPRSDSKKSEKDKHSLLGQDGMNDTRGEEQAHVQVQPDMYVTPTFMTYPLSAHFPYK